MASQLRCRSEHLRGYGKLNKIKDNGISQYLVWGSVLFHVEDTGIGGGNK